MQRQLLTMLAVALLSAPIGAATWSGFGTYEPDTLYDTQGGFMRPDPDVSPAGKDLYFNAYQSEYLTGQNGNVGTLGTRIQVPGAQQYLAMLGAWKDCNGDGYVGIAESALVVYPAVALSDGSICPAGSFHNDGDWVWEYVPVGYQYEAAPNAHPRQIVDEESRVWADFGLPGATAAATCPIVPLPHGTTAGTGWAIRYADCFASKRITGSVNDADPNDDLGLRFDDQNNPHQSDSLLNQQLPESLFGNPQTGETGFLQLDSDEDGGERDYAFTTWDCSDPNERTTVADPTGMGREGIAVPEEVSADGRERWADDDGNVAWFAAPAPALGDPTGSYADGLNQTAGGVHVGSGEDEQENLYVGGDCGETAGDDDQAGDNTYSGLHQEAFFYADGNNEGGTQFAAKNQADVQFQYFNGAEVDPTLADALGPSTPNSVVSVAPSAYLNDQGWSANIVYVTTPQSINRATLQPSGPAYTTFYAKVGATTLDAGWRAPHTGAKYGAEACGLNTSGQQGGWECDPSRWYLDSNGVDISDPAWDVRVGTTYQFRDIDCNDGRVGRDVGVFASLVLLSPGYGNDPAHLTCRDAP